MTRKKDTSENPAALAKKDAAIIGSGDGAIEETTLFERVSAIIETHKARAGAYANREVTLMYWEIGHHIGSVLLDGERAAYGKRIVATLSHQLQEKYGNSFERSKLNRMIKFARLFPDFEIVAKLSHQLSWSHFVELIPLKNEEALA